MSKKKKRLEKLRQNPKNVSFEELSQVLSDWGFVLKRTAGSHHQFEVEVGLNKYSITIPFRRPIKEYYVKEAVSIIDKIINETQDLNDD
ncbi:MAG: type II toxin-antitoxin system HicA family toxin [Anaerolineae bacterium]|nr:type II toxin-antitoxin system HicA family toxin [Anaerolineae bacterium]